MPIKPLSYCFCAHFGVFRLRLSPGFLLLGANEKVTLKMPVGEERKYSGYKNQIFVSGLLPSCKCPLLGASQCVCSSTSKTAPLSLKGKIGKEAVKTQCGLYHLHTPARHWQLRNTTTLYLLSRRAEHKYQKWQHTYCIYINTAKHMRWKHLHISPHVKKKLY